MYRVGRTGIQQRLLTAFLVVVVVALLPAAFMLERWIGDGMAELVRESLTRDAQLVAARFGDEQPADVQAWVARRGLAARITVIDGNSTVLGDSDVPAPALA